MISLQSNIDYWDRQAVGRIRTADGEVFLKGDPERWKTIAEFVCQYVSKNDKILEVGAGSGAIPAKVQSRLGFLSGYHNADLSFKFASFLKNQLDLSSVQGNAIELPFKGRHFDCVWLFDVLEHIPPLYRTTVGEEVDRVLKIGGAVMINNPIYQSKHDQDFEWLLTDLDMLSAFHQFRIHQKTTYWIKTAPQEFTVLTRRQT